MVIFLSGNEVIGYYPPEELTEERKAEILAENPNAMWIDEEIKYPDYTKSYKILYVDGKLVYEEIEEQKPQFEYEERISQLEATVALQKTQLQLQKTQLQQADDTAIELYEAQMVQDEINRAQDDALIELWELMEQQQEGGE